MARRKKDSGDDGGQPAWMVTFSDLMTLLLTFFVLLVSMAVIDERNKLVVLASVSTAFGAGGSQFNPITVEQKPQTRVDPGPMQEPDMTPIRDILFDNPDKDLNFQENRFVQILSINAEVLFDQDSSVLKPAGIQFIDRLVPFFQRIRYPMLIAGHTASRRDEELDRYGIDLDATGPDSTWQLSLDRAHAVYAHLAVRGVDPNRLTMEGFGQFRPRFPDKTPDGRLQNRRVDIVLDKRNAPQILRMEEIHTPPPPRRLFRFRGFEFDMESPTRRRP